MNDKTTLSDTASNDTHIDATAPQKNLENLSIDSLSYEELLDYLNAQTGKITWQELQPHFARGELLQLALGYDLIDTATALVRDDKTIILPMIENNVLGKMTDAQAKQCTDASTFWAVVVAPWVLIQPIETNT